MISGFTSSRRSYALEGTFLCCCTLALLAGCDESVFIDAGPVALPMEDGGVDAAPRETRSDAGWDAAWANPDGDAGPNIEEDLCFTLLEEGTSGTDCDFEGGCGMVLNSPHTWAQCINGVSETYTIAGRCAAEPEERESFTVCEDAELHAANSANCEGNFACAHIEDGCVMGTYCTTRGVARTRVCPRDAQLRDGAELFTECPPDTLPGLAEPRPTSGDRCEGDFVCRLEGSSVRAESWDVLLFCSGGIVHLADLTLPPPYEICR